MYQKGNTFYADWRDAEGKRRRKSFPTALGATRHEAKQLKARPQKGGSLPTNSPQSLPANAPATTPARGTSRRKPSSPSAEVSGSQTSPLVTSTLSKRATATSRKQLGAPLITASGASLRRSLKQVHLTSAARFPSPKPRKPGKSSPRKTSLLC